MAANSKPAPNGTAITVETLIAELGVVPTPKVAGEWTVDKATDAIFAPTGGDTHSKPAPDTSSPLPYFHLLELLKTTKREGWRRFGITHGESIADHMYRMSLMAMLAPPALAARLDMNRCIKMCLVHDMAEALVGDITPVDGVPKPEKSRREASTMDYITGTLLGQVGGGSGSKSGSKSGSGDGDNDTGAVGREIRAIWQEYEDAATPESHFVHDVDKMELLLQMHEYETRGQGHVDLGEFAYVATKMVLPETRAWAAALLQERAALWQSRGQAPPGQPTMPELEAAATPKTNGVDEANGHATVK
ncbi:hydrolase of HD superfamily [Sporothrix brasiliensis 5110]|uniref:5'-deoxynucleotidase n=1 Tax=Sporothrix brasiliensis 5110 TaxID=1398154 RepID=A0A0C2FFG1_9PEZI|nr:hydrolase of HD superfamily [Sporothrix brasiliensis 5110]KIH89868.1 hydrolase of HD superfamily [Sporothrix brasiliensis 5110]